MKIRTKATIFLTSIILITGLIVSIANQIISKKIIKEQIRLDLESTAQSRAYNVETFLNNHIELTKMISTGNVFRDMVDERADFFKTSIQIKRRISAFISSHPEIDRIRVLDKKGIIIADSYNEIDKDLSEEAVYKKGKESSYIGDIGKSVKSENIDICISNPIFVRNKFSGVLVINFDIEDVLFGIMKNRAGLGETGEIYLINRAGYMITPSRFLNNVILKQKVLTPESCECWDLSEYEETKEREEVDIYQSYHGEQVIGTHYKIKGTDCCLLAEISLKQALAPVRDLTIISIIILIILAVLIISISLTIVTSITNPIRKLHIGVNEILRGNADYKVATKSKDEIGQLSRAFDDMSSKLIKSKNELENYAVKLEKDVDERTVELKKHYQKSEVQRIATLSVLSDLNETTKNLKLEVAERKQIEKELIKAKEKAEESDRLKSAFLTNMSHEIRTPMNGILGFTELLKEPQLTGEEQDSYIKIIEKSGARMLNTINDIIDISKIEAGQVEVIKSVVSVNKLLKEQYDYFNSEAQSKGLNLIYKPSLSGKEAIIVTDRHKLDGILTNLIKNAIKYTEYGDVSFGYSLKKEHGFEYLEFYVNDTGIGIPSDRVKAIFNRFEQADIEDTRVFQGSGLGLAISKSYVEMLGGNISVTSEEGIGSTFVFTIPYTKQSTKNNDTEDDVKINQQVYLNKLSVIVAEDDETSQLFFKTIFRNKFHKISYTKSGKETIDEFQKKPETDIILMDVKMFDMSGYEATREIRKFNQDVVIIAQTAFGLSGDKEKAIEAGCDDYIIKPINKELLFEKIILHLSKKSI